MSTPQASPPNVPKADPDSLALRASPRPVTRLNRRMLAVITGVLAAAVLGATLWSLQTQKRQRGAAPSELYNVDRVARAETLDRLPADYAKTPPVQSARPVLGEPLPGDLGKPMLDAQRNAGGIDDSARVERLNLQRDAEEAAKAPVFFRSSNKPESKAVADPASSAAAQVPLASANKPFDAMAPTTASAQPSDPTALQNQQDQKQAFVDRTGNAATRNPNSLETPVSPYQIMAGTIIPAALVTGINSDLPGQVIATVTEAIYDTATGRHLLVPQGSRLLGRYDSQVAFGQRRVLLVWTRLILPDTSSIALDHLPGVDPAGYAGLEDGVDWHWDRILAGAALSTLLGVGAELAAPDRSNADSSGRVIIATRQTAQDSVNQAGQEITKRNLSVQPTLTIRPGFPMRVIVNKDLVLRPYQPLFFNRSAP